MLRITKDFTPYFYKKETWFTGDILKGFIFALCFHGVLFLLFRIDTFFDPNELPLLAPVSVEVDLSAASVQKSIVEPIFVLPIGLEESPVTCDFPECEWSLLTSWGDWIKSDFDFSEIEKMEYRSISHLGIDLNDPR